MPRNPDCTLCELHASSRNVCVWGDGDGEAFIVGEAPGEAEARTGKPFQGLSGQLLRKVLSSFNLDDAYITNAAKCRPPKNRKPEPSELSACKPYLHEEIATRKPRAILLLGATAMKACIGKVGITEMNGQVVEKDGQTYVCCFHPAYILRDPSKEPAMRMAINRYAATLKGELQTDLPDWKPVCQTTFDEFIDDWMHCDEFAFDVETTGLKWWEDGFKVNSIAFSLSGKDLPEKNWALPLSHTPVLTDELQRDLLKWLTENQGKRRAIAHNGKFDNLCLMAVYGVRFRLDSDTQLGHHLTDENSSHGLKSLARSELGAPDYDLTLKEKKGSTTIQKLLKYNAGDSAYTRRLDHVFTKRMDEQEEWLYRKVIMPSARAFEKIEKNGLYVDLKMMEVVEREVSQKLEEATAKLNQMAKREVNWNSPSQVAEVLFKDFGLTPTVLTEKGNPSTGEEALVDIDHPIAKLLEEYRNHEKFLSTYIGKRQPDGSYEGGWREFMVGPHLYLSTKLHGTVTGRYSSRLHQVPRDGTVRNIVTAPPGWKFGQLDLNQAELRTIAIVSRDPEMLSCFDPKTEKDIHWRTLVNAIESGGGEYVDLVYETAKAVTKKRDLEFPDAIDVIRNMTPDDAIEVNYLWKEGRKKAKGINFGFVFGQSANGFITYAKTKYGFEPTLQESTMFRDSFFNLYQAVPRWHERQKKLVRRDGFVRNMMGRIRRLPGIYSSDRALVAECERQAINSPIQGFIGDYKAAILVEVAEAFSWDRFRIVGEVHDSILFWYKDDAILPELHWIAEHPKLAKEAGLNFPIPLTISLELGRWGKGVTWKP